MYLNEVLSMYMYISDAHLVISQHTADRCWDQWYHMYLHQHHSEWLRVPLSVLSAETTTLMMELFSVVGDFHSAEKTHPVLSCLKVTGERTFIREEATNPVYVACCALSVVCIVLLCFSGHYGKVWHYLLTLLEIIITLKWKKTTYSHCVSTG